MPSRAQLWFKRWRKRFIILGGIALALFAVWFVLYYYTDYTRAGFLFHWYREYEKRLAEVGELPDTPERRAVLKGLGGAALEQTH